MFQLSRHLPVRIDISWLKRRAEAQMEADASHHASSHDLVERSRLVARILELNPTASPEFLQDFTIADLDEYLLHLVCAAQPRGRMARWIRPDNLPAYTISHAAA